VLRWCEALLIMLQPRDVSKLRTFLAGPRQITPDLLLTNAWCYDGAVLIVLDNRSLVLVLEVVVRW